MRKFYVRVAAIGIATSLSVSATAFAGPLAPGMPAGVHKAQATDKEWLVFGGLGVLGAGLLIATAGGGNSTVPAQVPTVVTTSATAP